MRDVNKMILVGRLGSAPILRKTLSGHPVANLSVATSRRVQDGQDEETTWHKVVCWGKTAEICTQYLTKGERVFVEGWTTHRPYKGKDGTSRVAIEVHATDVRFLGGGRKREDDPQAPYSIAPQPAGEPSAPAEAPGEEAAA